MNAPIIANYIVKLSNDMEWRMFKSSLLSIRPVVDDIFVVYAGENYEEIAPRLNELLHFHPAKLITVFQKVESFADVRNAALAEVPEGAWLYWIDADEVGFHDSFAALKARMMRYDDITQVRTRFIHFCLSPDWYERTEPRNTLIKKGPETHWEGKVHERIVGIPEGKILHSDYIVHHYGYCKPQAEVFKHWDNYAKLEGDPNRYVNEEVDGKTVSYFRPVDRPGPENILDDRKKVLIPYSGAYPDNDLRDYLRENCVKI